MTTTTADGVAVARVRHHVRLRTAESRRAKPHVRRFAMSGPKRRGRSNSNRTENLGACAAFFRLEKRPAKRPTKIFRVAQPIDFKYVIFCYDALHPLHSLPNLPTNSINPLFYRTLKASRLKKRPTERLTFRPTLSAECPIFSPAVMAPGTSSAAYP